MKHSILLLFLLWGCNIGKTTYVEPAPTNNERFYCEIDGERFRPNSNGDIFNEVLIADWYKSQGTFTVSAYNSKNYKDVLLYINLKGKNLIPQKHIMDSLTVNASYSSGYVKVNGNPINENWTSTTGFIEITKVDTLYKKVSGKFEFDARSELDKTKNVKIRNGQFNNLTY